MLYYIHLHSYAWTEPDNLCNARINRKSNSAPIHSINIYLVLVLTIPVEIALTRRRDLNNSENI